MSKVYVTQYTPRVDFSKAQAYGEVVFLTNEEYRPDPVPEGWNESIARQIRDKLLNYNPGIDYIITTGSAIPNVITGMCLMQHRRDCKHNILKWSNRKDDYELFHVNGEVFETHGAFEQEYVND